MPNASISTCIVSNSAFCRAYSSLRTFDAIWGAIARGTARKRVTGRPSARIQGRCLRSAHCPHCVFSPFFPRGDIDRRAFQKGLRLPLLREFGRLRQKGKREKGGEKRKKGTFSVFHPPPPPPPPSLPPPFSLVPSLPPPGAAAGGRKADRGYFRAPSPPFSAFLTPPRPASLRSGWRPPAPGASPAAAPCPAD